MERSTGYPLLEKDQAVIWHPYTQACGAPPPLQIARGEGAWLYSCDEEKILDAISSWWVTLHGHCQPDIAAAIAKQAQKLEHVIFAGVTHQPAVELAERLLPLLPGNMSRLFFSDNGSTAVEVAVKVAQQYWHNRGETRRRLVAFSGGYHGDTIGAMSLSERSAFTEPFAPFLFDVELIPPPIPGEEQMSLIALEKALAQDDVTAFLFEPFVQGVAGMVPHSIAGLEQLIALCRERDVLTIADEVMTGFGRTGPLFASEMLDSSPDMICMSKGITGGFLPLGATAFHERIYDAFYAQEKKKALFHGHSYCGNPLGCAAALASLDLLEKDTNRARIEQAHRSFQRRIGKREELKRFDVIGTILALELHVEESGYFAPIRDQLAAFFLERNLLIRPLGNVIYLIPPYCIQNEELELVYSAIEELLERYSSQAFS